MLKPQQNPRAIIQRLPVKSEIGSDSTSEKILFWDLLTHNKVKEIYFTGMLIHGQSDFFVQYIDPETHAIRSCYPDFLFKKDDDACVIVEVKADFQLNDPVVQAKKAFAERMASASGMTCQVIKSTHADNHQFPGLLNGKN